MSFIDCFRHELCGVVAGVPLYHPLEPITGDYDAGPDQLLLGGGSGEHAQAVLDPVRCVGSYLLLLAGQLEDTGYAPGQLDPDLASHWLSELGVGDADGAGDLIAGGPCDVLLGEIGSDSSPAGDFSSWGGDTWASFVAAARSPGAWTAPYDPSRHGSIENWVIDVVGEYVLVSMPELIAARVPDHLQATFDTLRQAAARLHLLCGVMTFPSGYDHMAGRRDQLGDGNVRR